MIHSRKCVFCVSAGSVRYLLRHHDEVFMLCSGALHLRCPARLYVVMMTVVDVNAIRDAAIEFNGLTRVNDPYTFYYDETNNIRRLHVTATGFNVRGPMCFVLGGIVHRGPTRQFDVKGLKRLVRLQATAKELKLAHLGKGGFLQLLASPKISSFLDWLTCEGLLVHYFALDPLYWSTVDIIDSIIAHDALVQLQPFHLELKNDLFTVLAMDVGDVASLFYRFSYPNVDPTGRHIFVAELLHRLKEREVLLEGFNFQMLEGVLDAGAGVESLVYLEHETPNTLIDSFAEFFISRICLFKNARHLLDVEDVIRTRLRSMTFRDGDQVLDNFQFVGSRDEPGVQVSDALVGLLGKLFSYITHTSQAQLMLDHRALTCVQLGVLAKLNALLDRSVNETPAFFQQVASLASLRRGQFFLEGR